MHSTTGHTQQLDQQRAEHFDTQLLELLSMSTSTCTESCRSLRIYQLV
ncbi:TPA: hypothetical protein N0F65_007204 [Lagenidium giganteum]|uniref:Uncharacterized protein n=1 Tax=Lagenidium giganteum TaxID=4803 RepID=A0AAV2Z8Z8_9STRA|nr:TPA: hypothetical protein N0F65_007204 [Lagenidium giganteum]